MDLSGKGIGDGPTRTVTGRLITVHRDSGSAIDVDMGSVDEIECESATRTDAITCHIELVAGTGREDLRSVTSKSAHTFDGEVGHQRGVHAEIYAYSCVKGIVTVMTVNDAVFHRPTINSADGAIVFRDIEYG